MVAIAVSAERWLEGGGEMGERIRAFDWGATPLGPARAWPQSLKTAVRIMLTSRQPIWIGWGPQLTYLYNDPYKAIIGGKHPHALGRPFAQVWREIYDVVGPMADVVMHGNEGTYVEAQLLIMERHGYQEETYYTFSYSPIPDDAGNPGGLICANTDDTRRVIGERQLALLRELAASTAQARTWEEACAASARALSADAKDLPFALICTAADDAAACVAGASGIDASGSAAQGLAALRPDGDFRVVELDARFGAVPTGAWQRPPATVAVVPIPVSAEMRRSFCLVVGINPFRELNEGYRGFLQLAAGQIASSIANAEAYEQERRRAEALAELDRAKTAFFSNVSHEFRTPLTLMLGPVEDGLRDAEQPLPPAQRERQELVRRNGLRLQKLVNTLLDFSRIEAGRAQPTFVRTRLEELTADIASSFRSAIEKAGLELEVVCDGLGEPVYVDRDMWEKIVLNLVSNAFKFTFAGRITVALRRAGERVELEVRDTGVGIPAAEVPRLFERFRRVEGVRSRTHEGTGIGLALVRELARLHGGEVTVRSVEGEGTAFTVSLPRGSAHLSPETIAVSQPSHAPRAAESFVEESLRWLPDAAIHGIAMPIAPPGTSRERIVWADDNADMRDYVRRLLGTRYEVEAVADGEAALAAIRARRPALVLADVMMPVLDGLGLLKALRTDPATRTLPVILLSARAGEEARSEGLGAGADDYLYKPFAASELLARVAARIELVRLQELIERERAALVSLFAQTPVATAVLKGADLRFEMANPAYRELVGGRDVVGKPLLEALPELAGQGFDDMLHGVIRSGQAYVARESPARIERNGAVQEVYFTFIYAPLRDGQGRVEGAIVIAIEVTEQLLARRKLAEADRRKDEFLATLAHELRNPLAPIRNALQLLRMRGGEEATLGIREMMERQVNHLVRLVDDLLEISRITRGTFELRKERVDAALVVRNAVETAQPLVDAGGHKLEVDVPGGLLLDGDPVRLAQIVSNLLNNAAKYIDAGGKIVVSGRREGPFAAIRVTDNGPGIPSEAMPRLFEMFNRGERSNQRAQDGLGIGLALSRRLAEMHGGTLEARSGGGGSEFELRLPLASSPVSAHAS